MPITIASIIVTFNPNEQRFSDVVTAALRVSDIIYVVDNRSSNLENICRICKEHIGTGKFDLVKLDGNFGIASALNEGVKKCLSGGPIDFVLTLDQDSVINITRVELERYIENASILFGNRIGAISLSHTGHIGLSEEFKQVDYGIISGMLTKTELFKRGLRYRDEFFMDQVDLDLSFQIAKMGRNIISTRERTIDHELGEMVRRFGKRISIESDWRLYLLLRNSTALLREKRIGLKFFLYQSMRQIGHRILASRMRENFRLPIVALVALHDGHSRNFSDNFKFSGK